MKKSIFWLIIIVIILVILALVLYLTNAWNIQGKVISTFKKDTGDKVVLDVECAEQCDTEECVDSCYTPDLPTGDQILITCCTYKHGGKVHPKCQVFPPYSCVICLDDCKGGLDYPYWPKMS